MKKVIVTGANGFVGSATVKVLLEEGMEVYAIDLRGHQNNLPEQKNLHFIPCDLDNIESLQTLIPQHRRDGAGEARSRPTPAGDGQLIMPP